MHNAKAQHTAQCHPTRHHYNPRFACTGGATRFTVAASTPNTMQDHYAALGVAPDAPLADIRQAFRLKASQYHPDKNPSPDAPRHFRAVQEAYDVLSTPERRAAFDDNRRRGLLDSPQETAQDIWHNYLKDTLS